MSARVTCYEAYVHPGERRGLERPEHDLPAVLRAAGYRVGEVATSDNGKVKWRSDACRASACLP